MPQYVPPMAQPGDIGARVRAARSYANLSQQQLADAIDVERRIIGYIEGNEPRHELTVPEAHKIAAACRVPASFLLDGWTATDGIEQRINALENAFSVTRQDRDEIARQLGELSAELETARAMSAKQVLELTQWLQSIEDRLPGDAGSAP